MNSNKQNSTKSPWLWVPSLYFAEGMPYVVVMIVTVIMYKRLGVSNSEIALYTSWLYLPWVIKPLWSPIVDIVKTKRFWIISMQLLIGAGLAGVALTIPTDNFLRYTLAFLWLLAFSSATHDISADGFYMLGLSKHEQTWFVGVRSTFYRLAMITGQGLLIILAGYVESTTGMPSASVNVHASPSIETTAFIHPDSIHVESIRGPLHLITFPEELEVKLTYKDQGEVDSLVAFAKAWNRQHGFYYGDLKGNTSEATSAEHSWWNRNIQQKLEQTISKYFGPKGTSSEHINKAGNTGVVYFTLSGPIPAGEKYIVNFGRESGDNSIRIIEGERFSYDDTNWNKPMMALIQIDPKLNGATSTQFLARSGNIPLAWAITFYFLAGLFVIAFAYHKFMLPRPGSDVPQSQISFSESIKEYFETFGSFFRKKHIGLILAFLLLYRFSEAQLAKMASPFLLDVNAVGGLALTTGEVGFAYGTVGILMLTVGGLCGGFIAARHGLKRWLLWMVLAINLPNAVYIFLSYTVPDSLLIINLAVGVEQFGYGFGFTAYMLYMIYISEGKHKTAHFAICTGFMALGMMIPGMFSGWLQELIGYQHFFVWVLLATIPSFFVAYLIPLDSQFGKKEKDPSG